MTVKRMIYELGLDVRDFTKGLDEAGKGAQDTFDDIEDAGDNSAGRFDGVGSKMGKALVAGFAAVGVGAFIIKNINDAFDRRDATAKLRGQFALTADEAKRFGELAGDMYSAGWGTGVAEVATTFAQLSRQLEIDNDATLAVLARNAESIAKTWDVDVNDVIRSTSQLLQNGLVPDAEAAMDLITAAFQLGGDEAGDLLDTIDEYSQHWENMGLSGEDALNQIIHGFQSGQRDADKMADAIKEMFIRVTDDSTSTRTAFQNLGLDADDMRDRFLAGGESAREAFLLVIDKLKEAQKSAGGKGGVAEAVALIGTQFEDLGPKALESLATVDGALDVTTGKAEALAETVQASEKDRLFRDIEVGAARASEAVAGGLNKAFNELAGDLASHRGNVALAEWFNGGEQRFAAAGDWVRDFDSTLLNNAKTFEEAHAAALAYADEALGETNESMMAANTVSLAWQETHKSLTDQIAKDSSVEQLDWELEQLSGHGDDVADSLEDVGDEAGDAADEMFDLVDQTTLVNTAFRNLRREISEKREVGDLLSLFGDVETAAREAFIAARDGAEDAAQKVADLEEKTDTLRLKVLDYAEGIGQLPDEMTTEILALLDEGNLAEVEAKLLHLERLRTARVAVTAFYQGGGALPSLSTSGQAGSTKLFGATGGIVNRRTDNITLGESGPEAVIPLDQSPGNSPLPGGLGGNTNVYLTVHAGMGTDGAQVGKQIVDVIKRYERVNGSRWRA